MINKPGFCIVETDAKGRVIMRVGVIVTLYFHHGHSLHKREGVLRCFREYQQMCGEQLRWWVVEGETFNPVSKLRNRDMAPYLLSAKFEQFDQSWAFFWHGGDRKEDASDFRFRAFGESKSEAEAGDELSFLQATFPVDWFENDWQKLTRLTFSWAERMEPFHGYAGIGILDAADRGLAAANEKSLYALAQRHPGLEADYPLQHGLWTKGGIKGSNWLTVLSNGFIERLGGIEFLTGNIEPPLQLMRYAGGAIIVAGPRPEVGDRNRGVDTPTYRKIARLLKANPHYLPSGSPWRTWRLRPTGV